jgi:hypothetical protein
MFWTEKSIVDSIEPLLLRTEHKPVFKQGWNGFVAGLEVQKG